MELWEIIDFVPLPVINTWFLKFLLKLHLWNTSKFKRRASLSKSLKFFLLQFVSSGVPFFLISSSDKLAFLVGSQLFPGQKVLEAKWYWISSQQWRKIGMGNRHSFKVLFDTNDIYQDKTCSFVTLLLVLLNFLSSKFMFLYLCSTPAKISFQW